jgi:rhamnosyltransferase subunit B
MSHIVFATFGSLGDLHPMIALGLELRGRGHHVTLAAMKYYRQKVESLGLAFRPMAPHLEPDEDLARELMDAHTGTERILRDLIMPNLRPMYEDLVEAIEGADLLVTGEVVYAAKSAVEKTGVRWVSTTLAPISLFSTFDPPVPPQAPWFENLRFLGSTFHDAVFRFMRWTVSGWFDPYKEFRRELGLDDDHDPIFAGKYSGLLHLVLFSRVLGSRQPDWPQDAVQAGFCFYDGHAGTNEIPDEVQEFLDAGEPPLVFTLGSAAVMDARDFFEQSAAAARNLNRRALLIYGTEKALPKIDTEWQEPKIMSSAEKSSAQNTAHISSDGSILAIPYAPYSQVFPHAACVVHQGGAGTTGQVLRAGVPHLIMPYGHDQPDNAARCRRIGVAKIIARDDYNSENASIMLRRIVSDAKYKLNAERAAEVVRSEHGTQTACDAIESVLRD